MPQKLHLKRTPAEEAERQYRKAIKAARKEAKRKRQLYENDRPCCESDGDSLPAEHGGYTPRKRGRRERKDRDINDHSHGAYASYEDFADEGGDTSYGPPPPAPGPSSSSYKPDYDTIRADIEDSHFREKMWDALRDDERLDGVEATMNDYAHVPRRWRGAAADSGAGDGLEGLDPRYMEDEEYAEWIRMGMWRRKHADEVAAQARQQAASAARRAREDALKAETARFERAVAEETVTRRQAKEARRRGVARELYEQRWKVLLGPAGGPEAREESRMGFQDVPWPVFGACSTSTRVEDITPEAISTFLFPASDQREQSQKERKDRLRETMLRFHPDKFEGRIMPFVKQEDRTVVSEVIGVVIRALNTLMQEKV